MTVTIGRRELLAALDGAAAAWPLAAPSLSRRGPPCLGAPPVYLSAHCVALLRAALVAPAYFSARPRGRVDVDLGVAPDEQLPARRDAPPIRCAGGPRS